MTGLPPSWSISTIGDVADLQLGRQRSPKNHTGEHMRPYLRAANVTWDGIDLADVKEMNFDPHEAERFELVEGDLLLNEASGSPNEVGKPAIWRGQIPGACFQNTLLRLRSRGPSTKFLYWYCYRSALLGEFGEAGRGVNIRHLGKKGLAAFPIPLPPLAEQERIVAAIEEYVSHLDAAEAALDDAEKDRERLRLALTLEALRGQWPTHPLGEHTFEQRYGSSAKASPEGDVPVLRMGNIVDGQLDFENLKYLPADHEDLDTCVLEDGDLLFNRTNSPELVGKSAVYRDTGSPVAFASYLIRVRTTDDLDPDWACQAINSPGGRRYIDEVRTQQVGQSNVNGTKLKNFPIPVPPLHVQKERLAALHSAEAQISRTRESIIKGRRRATTLRRSLLASAFAGRLVGQDPDDEPAAVLLERVRAKTATTKKTTRRKKASA